MTLKSRILRIVLDAGDAGIRTRDVILMLKSDVQKVNEASVRGALARMSAYGVLVYDGVYRAT